MVSKSPRHRWEAVRDAFNAATPPADDRAAELHAALRHSPTADENVAYALDLFRTESHRSVVDAFLLAGTTPDIISNVLSIPVSVLKEYEYFFFDLSAFRNRLEKISYASEYDGDKLARELVKTGVMVGPNYLIWTYGGTEDVDTRQVVRHTMVDAYFRGMAHKGNSLTSGVTRESQKWWGTAIRNAEILEKMDPRTSKQAHEELRIALDGVDETTSVENSPVPLEDILH